MYTKPTSLIEFLLEEERKQKNATGRFTLLMAHLEQAGKIIASHLKKAGLVDIIGATGAKNASQDEVKKIDVFANDLLFETLKKSGFVYAIGSEEMEEIEIVNNHGEYVVFFDPLDGSSNVEPNMICGTIFSIYHKSNSLLQPGRKQVAAGYLLYGTSVMFVYTVGRGVNGFTLDPSMGSFLLSHPNIQIPKTGSIYFFNEAYTPHVDSHIQNYLSYIKERDEKTKRPYTNRVMGAVVAEVHRILIKGGIYFYPSTALSPHGKIRLMYEINPLSFIIEQAGGKATSDLKNPLDIVPQKPHEKIPIAFGSEKEVELYESFYKGHLRSV